MKPIGGFSNVQESGDFARLTEGGYIVRITAVKDKEDKSYLEVQFDIATGQFEGYYKALNERAGFWGGQMIRSYKEKALGMFKAFLAAVDKSNGTDFVSQVEKGFNEELLVGKRLGVVLGKELYTKNNGEDGDRLVVVSCKPVQDIIDGNYRVPEVKDRRGETGGASTAPSPVEGFTPADDTDLPF